MSCLDSNQDQTFHHDVIPDFWHAWYDVGVYLDGEGNQIFHQDILPGLSMSGMMEMGHVGDTYLDGEVDKTFHHNIVPGFWYVQHNGKGSCGWHIPEW